MGGAQRRDSVTPFPIGEQVYKSARSSCDEELVIEPMIDGFSALAFMKTRSTSSCFAWPAYVVCEDNIAPDA